MMSKPVTFSVVRAKHDIIVNAALLREGLRRGKELYACRSAGGIRSKIAEVVILRDIREKISSCRFMNAETQVT